MIKRIVLLAIVIAVYLAHQDVWNFKTARPLVFGFIPIGLAYHIAYSLTAAAMMALLVRYAWPKHLEDTHREP